MGAGDLLGRIVDLAGNVVEELQAPEDGSIVMRRLVPNVYGGQPVFLLAGPM